MKKKLTILLFLFIFIALSGCTSQNLTSLTEYIPKPTNYNKHIRVKVIPKANQEAGKTPSIEESIDQTIEVLKKRLNPQDKKKVLIQKEGEDIIKISIPENTDVEKVKELIQCIGILEFKEQDPKTNSWRTVLTGACLKPNSAKVDLDQYGSHYISIEFDPNGAKLFGEITKRNIKKHIAIYLDGKEISSPIVASPILNGICQISGYGMRLEECEKIAILLNSGSLNADIQILDDITGEEEKK